MAKLCLGIALLCSFVFADTDPHWEGALKLLQEAKHAEAIPLLEAWLTEAEAQGTRSPEAHHNLATAYAATENWGPAVLHLATGATLRNNPLYLGESLRTLSRVQNRLMIQDAVSSHWGFRLAIFLGRGLLLTLALGALWFFAFGILYPRVRSPLWTTAGILFVLSLAGYGVKASLPQYAVILAGAQGAPLMTESAGANAKKLVDVPSGTLVALGGMEQGEEVYITQPFAGWVPRSSSVWIR